MFRKIKEIKNRISNSIFFWGSLGSCSLIFTFIVFVVQCSIGILSPFWWVGFACSCLLGLCVTILSMMEVASIFQDQTEKMQILQEEMTFIQSSLREAQIEKLEEKETLQNEIQLLIQSNEEEQNNLRNAYEKLFGEHIESKNKAHSLQVSLEAALEELGKSRQLEFLKQELELKLNEIQAASQLKQEVVPVPVTVPVTKIAESSYEKYFLDHIHQMNEELHDLDYEVKTLQEILTKVLSEKKVSKPRKAKSQPQLDLLQDEAETNLF